MIALVFDTEHCGYHGKDKAARVIQLAWTLVDCETGETITKHCYLIRPDGWKIPVFGFWKDHGFTTYNNMVNGHGMANVLTVFLEDYERADVLVAHNIKHDIRILSEEMRIYGKRANKRIPRVCTMEDTKHHFLLKNKKGGLKAPSLAELYRLLFGKEMVDAHDAWADVNATSFCFVALVKKQIIKINNLVNQAENGKQLFEATAGNEVAGQNLDVGKESRGED
jgi:DNA polymerase-3 subunit alpha